VNDTATADKPARSDAKLKRLPDDLQEQLYKYATMPNVTQENTRAWLETEHGIKTSAGAFSEWMTWYAARKRTLDRQQKVLGMLQAKKAAHPEWTDDYIFSEGQSIMALLTLAEEDPKGWALIQRTARDREAGAMDRAKFKRETLELFVKWFADKRAAEILTSGSTHEEKLRALDQAMFPEDWAK